MGKDLQQEEAVLLGEWFLPLTSLQTSLEDENACEMQKPLTTLLCTSAGVLCSARCSSHVRLCARDDMMIVQTQQKSLFSVC